MSTRRVGPRPPGAPLRHLLGYWFVLFIFVQSACAARAPWGSLTEGYRYTSLTPPPAPKARVPPSTEPGLESATVYVAAFLEPGAVATRPVPIPKPDFQRTFQRLAQDVRLGQRTPREAALELLRLSGPPAQNEETVESTGEWNLETYRGQGYTLVPERQTGPVSLTPEANEALKQQYLQWCAPQGGGDCLRLLDDGPYLKADDRYPFALALAFGRVLDETRAALKAELLSVQALVSMVVWSVALYCMMWVVPEPTTKLVAASLIVLLMGYLGLSTVYGLMDGWARLVIAAGEATTFDELRAAGEDFGKVLGEDAARAMILAVSTLAGHTLGQVLPRLKSLPGFTLAAEQFEAQGGAAVMTHAERRSRRKAPWPGPWWRRRRWPPRRGAPWPSSCSRRGMSLGGRRREEAAPRKPSSATGAATGRSSSVTANAGTSLPASPWRTYPPRTRWATCSRRRSTTPRRSGGPTGCRATSETLSTKP